jgi:7-carboxy-7-deazaguanine synthase
MSSLRVSEVFTSLQGEGASAGVPATFLRLGDCNLSCRYCDTPYSWDWQRYDRKSELSVEDFLATAARIRQFTPHRLVITGGEPLLQQPALELLVGELREFFIEVETNGTICPSDSLRSSVGQWNVSPKLSASGIEEAQCVKRDVLASFLETKRAWLKFVVVDSRDLEEVLQIVAAVDWPAENVILMPEARSPADLAARSTWVAEAALRHGFRFSTRLQILLWNNARGY